MTAVEESLLEAHNIASKAIVIDARCVGSGIGTYAQSLLTHLRCKKREFTIKTITSARYQELLRPYCDQLAVIDAPMYSIREQLQVPRATRGADLLHALHYNAPLLHRGAMVVTIHDLTHIIDRTFRKSLKSVLYAQPMLRLVAKRADHIITVSQYSKRCIVDHLGVPTSRISVIYNGVSREFSPAADRIAVRRRAADLLGTGRPYVLFVGNLKPHKNIGNLLRAFAGLVESKSIAHQLVIVGDDPKWKDTISRQIDDFKLESRVNMFGAADAGALLDLYRAADLFVLPSFEEGFGLPVLEAMACGTPVACSRAASLPEVAGDAAEYFDPNSPENMADCIARVLESNHTRARLRSAGLKRASEFSWARCAEQHYEIYKRFLRS